MKILVTGGFGFIGSNWIKQNNQNNEILLVDNISTGANTNNLSRIDYKDHLIEDICNLSLDMLEELNFIPEAIVHFAAESHVDRSIDNPLAFIRTNVLGTSNLLNVALEIKEKYNNIRFLHVSTDEVFGHLSANDLPFTEDTKYNPRSPYSASKASSDHIVRSFHETYGLDVVITNCCNNYGPRQYPEKLIPVVIKNALSNKEIPVYGNGYNIREWIYVDDHNDAITNVLNKGVSGDTYCIGSGEELSNIDLVTEICRILDETIPKDESYTKQITFVKDRLGHDFRYAIDSSKIRNILQWTPKVTFNEGLRKTINWYVNEYK